MCIESSIVKARLFRFIDMACCQSVQTSQRITVKFIQNDKLSKGLNGYLGQGFVLQGTQSWANMNNHSISPLPPPNTANLVILLYHLTI
jgi:hypothetical protein